MALSLSTAAYSDCYDFFDRARANLKGIRVLFQTKKEANLFRQRMNQARVLERREAMRIYERNDPQYGKSENDKFRIKMLPAAEDDGSYWVYVEPWNQSHLVVEELE